MMTSAGTPIETPLGSPTRAPTPASPANSVSSAPTEATNKVTAESNAHRVPKIRRINAPCPSPVTSPRRTVISCTRYRIGINTSWESTSW